MFTKQQIKLFCDQIVYIEDDLVSIQEKLKTEKYYFKKIPHDNMNYPFSKKYLLGNGGQAYVVLGEHIETKEQVAIKFSKSNKQIYDEMTKELNCIKKILNYDYIVQVKHSYFLQEQLICIQIIELCSKSLFDEIKEMRDKGISYSQEQIVFIMQSAINILCEIHTNDIIHFDIKPSNILITKDGKYKLADFGHSKPIQIDQSHIKCFGGGTPYYNSPEQYQANLSEANNNINPDIQMRSYTDIFSMGVCLLEVLGVKIDFDSFNFLQSDKIDLLDAQVKEEYKNMYSFIKYFMLQNKWDKRYSAIRLRSIFFEEFESCIKKEQEKERLLKSIKQYEQDSQKDKNKKYLAYLYCFLSDLDTDQEEAEKYIKKSLSILESLNLKGKVEESIFLLQYSKILQKVSKFEQSVEFLNKSHLILIQLHQHQANHPDIAASLSNLGKIYGKLGDTKNELKYDKEALAMFQALYQGNHPDKAESLNNLGVSYGKLGDTKKEFDNIQKALTMREELYQGNHPDIALSLNNLGVCYGKQGNTEKELEYKQRALKMKQSLYQGNHPDIALSLNNLAVCYGKQGNTEKELQYKQRALKMRESLYQGNHPDIASSLNNVGISYEKLGDDKKESKFYKRALDYYKQALTMLKALHQGNHPDIALSLNNLGLCYGKLGDAKNELEFYKRALDYCKQALKMREGLYQGNNHPDIASSLYNVYLYYLKQGQQQIGKEFYEKYQKMKEQLRNLNDQV